MNWRINKLLLPHNPYFGAKHIPLFSQRPFHFPYPIGTLFIVTRQLSNIFGLLIFIYSVIRSRSSDLSSFQGLFKIISYGEFGDMYEYRNKS